MKTLVYIFGQPGAGKTTLIRAMCDRLQLLYEASEPIKHRCFCRNGRMFAVLGSDGFPFGGTDTLSYTAVSSSDRWLKNLSDCAAGSTVFAEGDRLANDRLFEAASKHYNLLLIYLECAEDITASRREKRAAQYRIPLQSNLWVKSRATKHANLAARHKGVLRLDGRKPPDQLAESVWNSLLTKEQVT